MKQVTQQLKDKAEQLTGIKGVAHLFPKKETSGNVTISQYSFNDDTDPLYNLRQILDGNSFMTMVNGAYVRMHIDGHLMMSDTKMERETNTEFISQCNGDVLIAGLGLGLILINILNKSTVKSVTVIEKNADVISLVHPKVKHRKLNVINADIFTYQPSTKYDSIYFDIWAAINTDNLDDMKTLHKRYRPYLNKANPNNYMNSWMRGWLQKEKANERRGSYFY